MQRSAFARKNVACPDLRVSTGTGFVHAGAFAFVAGGAFLVMVPARPVQ